METWYKSLKTNFFCKAKKTNIFIEKKGLMKILNINSNL